MDYDKADRAMPVTLPPGLGISTSDLNFADSKITATVTDGICKAVQDIVPGDGYKCPGISETGAQRVDPRYKRSLLIEGEEGREASLCG